MESYTVYASTMASMDFGHIYGKNRSLLMLKDVSNWFNDFSSLLIAVHGRLYVTFLQTI